MAKARNVFLKSKMNKDLDARLIQNGEYRDALNVQVSQSEGSDVGAVENILGNTSVLNFQDVTGTANLKSIGYVVDNVSESAFLFLTNDAGANYILRYSQSGSYNILVEGDWLNFSSSHPVKAATIIEDLLFFTDNFNQPRKINWRTAIQFNTSTTYYYTNEQQISVAKFAPYLSPRLINLNSEAFPKPSTMTNAIDLPTTIIGATIWATKNLQVTAFRDGTAITEAQDINQWVAACNATTGYPAWCYYDFDPNNGKIYGKIYNAYCLRDKNIAPIGYKVPRESDFNSLLSTVNNDISLLKSTNNSSQNPADSNYPYIPGTWIASAAGGFDYAGSVTNNEFFDSIPTGYRRGNVAATPNVDFINIGGSGSPNFQNNGAYYWVKGSSPGAEKVLRISGNSYNIGLAPTPSSNDHVGYYIRCIREADYDGWNGDPEYLRDKFARFSYRFKFDDNEYSLVAPFTQSAFIPDQEGYFYPGDGEKTFRSTIVDFMQNYANNFVLNIPLPSGSIHKDYKVKELDILLKESDGLSFKVIETIDVNEDFDVLYTPRTTTVTAVGGATDKFITTDAENGIIPGYFIDSIGGVALNPPLEVIDVELNSTSTPPTYIITVAGAATFADGDIIEASYAPQPVYQYNYQSLKPYKTLPEKEVVRVYDKVPVAALAQESAGNRIMYGNFVANHASVRSLDYKIGSADKSPQEDIEYPNHNIKQNRNYKVGVVLADKWGRQSDVILSKYDNVLDEFGQPEEGSNIFHAYKRDNFQPNINSWKGDNLTITFNDIIPEEANYAGISGYPGAYAISKYYTTPYNGATPTLPYRYFEEVSQNANGTWTYKASNLFDGWNQTTAEDYFNSNKRLRGYYIDYVKIVSTTWDGTTSPTLPSLTIVCADRIADNYLFQYNYNQGGVFVDTLLGERTRASYDINELGFYSYRVVVQQKQQDYYNVYLPGIVNGYPINGNTDEVNETAHVVLIGDNVNKVPRDLKEVGPTQTEFNSSVSLFGRVTNSNDGAKKNEQYYPSPTPDSVVLISDQKTLFGPIPDYTGLGAAGAPNGLCLYPGFPISYIEQQAGSTTTVDVTNTIPNSNPLVAKISVNSGIGETEDNFSPGGSAQQYPASMSLAVYETQPVESVLDIFWESSTTGLISDLNQDIFSTASGPIGFTAGTTISVHEGMANGTNISTDFFPIDAAGNNVLNTIGVLASVYSKNADGTLNSTVNRNEEFALIANANGSYYLRLFSEQVALDDYQTAEYYQFNIQITLETGETTILSLETTLQNQSPVWQPGIYDAPFNTGCLSGIDYFNSVSDQATVVAFGNNLRAKNGSAKTDSEYDQLYFEILYVNAEPIANNCSGQTPVQIQCNENGSCGAVTPPSQRTFTIAQNSQYAPGKCTINVNPNQPLSGDLFYEIRLRVTDLSSNSVNGGGESAEVSFGVAVETTEYSNKVVWGAYTGQTIDSNLYPNNANSGPWYGHDQAAGQPYEMPQSNSNISIKRGAIQNWTATPVTVYLGAYACASQQNNIISVRARMSGGTWQNITAGGAYVCDPNIIQIGSLAAFNPSATNLTPSLEEGSMANNVEIQLLTYNNRGGTGNPEVHCGIFFYPTGGGVPGGGPLPSPSNYYTPGGTSPFQFEPVTISNPPFPYNSNGNFTWNDGTFED